MVMRDVLNHFENVKGHSGRYMARCPCHCDVKNSLSITEKKNIILIHCFAGCKASDILDEVGLTFHDLRDSRCQDWTSFRDDFPRG